MNLTEDEKARIKTMLRNSNYLQEDRPPKIQLSWAWSTGIIAILAIMFMVSQAA